MNEQMISEKDCFLCSNGDSSACFEVHRTALTKDILESIDFKDKGKCDFEHFENMSYWVKNGICLFYNTPVKTDYQESFYIGYAEQRQGKYVAVAFRWINNLEELTEIYESISTGYKLEIKQ